MIGFVLLIVAAATAVAQILYFVSGDPYRPVSIGSMWYAVDGNSLVGFQGLIEKNLGGMVWAPIQFLLTVPAWISLAVPGIVLVLLCRTRERGFGRF
ncbi:MAG: hypothetical protein KDG89_07980 [Geminicoccaceae bacterium]|nr:hypothetical protein [Geminicoccaceae bacterium]